MTWAGDPLTADEVKSLEDHLHAVTGLNFRGVVHEKVSQLRELADAFDGAAREVSGVAFGDLRGRAIGLRIAAADLEDWLDE